MSLRPSCRRNTFLRRLTGLALLLPALPGHAFTPCVNNGQQLHDALLNAALSSDINVVIKVRTGTYTATDAVDFATTLSHSNQVVEISGGWSGPSNSCQEKTFDSSATVLVGSANKPALYFKTSPAVSGSTLYVHDVTLTNPNYINASYSACLAGYLTAGNEAVVDRVQMFQCIAPGTSYASAYLENKAGTLTVRNVVASTGTAQSNGGIAINTYDGGMTRVAQVSVTATESLTPSSTVSGLSIENYGNSFTYVSNSVFWRNDGTPTTADLSVAGTGVFLTRTHYGTLRGTPTTNLSPSTGQAGFVSSSDAHLRADSILIDSGVTNPVGSSGTFDVEGHARVVGAAVDIGAFESDRLFADGFQTTP
jgi:hypothetical protein